MSRGEGSGVVPYCNLRTSREHPDRRGKDNREGRENVDPRRVGEDRMFQQCLPIGKNIGDTEASCYQYRLL